MLGFQKSQSIKNKENSSRTKLNLFSFPQIILYDFSEPRTVTWFPVEWFIPITFPG